MLRRLVAGALLGIIPIQPATAGQCRVIDLTFVPAEGSNQPMRAPLQIVAWLEDGQGNYIDTMFVTAQIGMYGLGNRPGRADFNSGPMWPYGRRTMVFPVWSHKHGMLFPELVFQDGQDSNLSHRLDESSLERHYCLPLRSDSLLWAQADAGTCATPTSVGTDKGLFGSRDSRYPPRSDLMIEPNKDHPDASMFAMLNPFDTVSRATPPSGVVAEIGWSAPPDLPDGDYTVWLEVSREFDFNATYSEAAYPAPAGIPFAEWGEPFRGQPSILYRVPVQLSSGSTAGSTLDYAGYGDPDALDGNVRAPDATITTGVSGSGAERFAIRADGGTPYRVRVGAQVVPDFGDPAAPTGTRIDDLTSTAATISFRAPGDDHFSGKVKGYEVRYVVGQEITEDNFATATPLEVELVIGDPGVVQTFTIDKLLYETSYSVGVRAFDDCGNVGPIAVVPFTTKARLSNEVDACFVATVAYGSPMAADVALLRRFRDGIQHTVVGELAVEAYYTFGPAVAGVVGESDLLRATARGVLSPIITTVRRFVR